MTTAFQQAQALMAAAGRGDMAALRELGQDAALLRRSGEDALFEACEQGQLEAVQWLAAQGISLTGVYQDPDNAVHVDNYPLFIAAQCKQWRVVEWLLDQGVTDSQATLRWALWNAAVANELDLFRRILAARNYVAEWMAGRQDNTFAAALGALLVRDNRQGIAICLEFGLPAQEVFVRAVDGKAAGIAQDMLEQGATLAPALVAEWVNCEPASEGEYNTQRVLAAWGADCVLDDNMRGWYVRNLQSHPRAPSHRGTVPAALELARAGFFMQDVAPMMTRYGAAVLNAACPEGCTVADVALRRGELMAAFSPKLWQGRAQAAADCIDALPLRIQRHLDKGAIMAAIRQHHLQQGRPRGLRL